MLDFFSRKFVSVYRRCLNSREMFVCAFELVYTTLGSDVRQVGIRVGWMYLDPARGISFVQETKAGGEHLNRGEENWQGARQHSY